MADSSRRLATDHLAKAAAWYARSGLKVFPCVPSDKNPMTPDGFLGASADAAVVKEWWDRCPNGNIGIPMAPNGLVAVDADVYKPACGWDGFIADKELPPTWTQRTASGGHHFIFEAPAGSRFRGSLTKFVEIKSAGYIIAAPSIFEGKVYERLRPYYDAAPAPRWLLDAVPAGVVAKGARPLAGEDGYDLLAADAFELS